MGILDRLRRSGSAAPDDDLPTSAAEAEAAADEGAVAAPQDVDPGAMVEQRGDFMLMPPMRPTFGRPMRFQHPVSEFAVTRRAVAVTDEPLTHAVEPERLGTFVARARRTRGRPRPRRSELVHRQDEEPADLEEGIAAPALPPPLPPRRLKAAPVTQDAPASEPLPQPQLPSAADVRRAVVNRAPMPARPGTPTIEGTVVASAFDPSTLPRAALSEVTDDVPVIRRRPSRGRVSDPIVNSVDEENAELLESFVQGITSDVDEGPMPSAPLMRAPEPGVAPDELPAPRAADLPALNGPTRVRGASPPVAAESGRPDRPTLAGAAPLVEAQPTASPAPPAGPDPDLEHAAPRRADDPPVPAPAAPSAPAAPWRPEGVERPPVVRPNPQGDTSSAERATAGPTPPRPTLGTREPLVSGGRTGVQRLARDAQVAERPPLAPPVRPAGPAPASAPAPASGPGRGSGPVPDSRPATEPVSEASSGSPPTAVPTAVPQQVREAVAKAVGSAPAIVPVHQGEHTDAMTDEINAQAFTRDGEIHLAGDVSLATPEGQAVLAHELTHVVQQRGGAQAMPDESSDEGQAHEEQAREVQRTLLAPPSAAEPPALALAAPPAAAAPVALGETGLQRSPRVGGADAPPTPAPAGRPAPLPTPASSPVGMRRAPAAKATAAAPTRPTPQPLETLGPPRSSSKPESEVVVPTGVQRNPRRDSMLDTPGGPASTSVPAVRDGEDVFDPFGGEDRQEQSKPKWYQSGGTLDSMFSSSQGYDDVDDDDADDPRAELERQAETLYPLIRARLRAELVRDRERRGRLAREWR